MATDFHHRLKEEILAEYGLAEATLRAAFRAARTEWIASDERVWLDAHGFYAPAVASVRRILAHNTVRVYIITTKGKDFAVRLLRAAGLGVDPAHVYGLGSGPKPVVLRGLLGPAAPRCVFVEDRLKTLQAVRAAPGLGGVQCALAAWGYNTAADRTTAAEAGISVIDTAEFDQLLLTLGPAGP